MRFGRRRRADGESDGGAQADPVSDQVDQVDPTDPVGTTDDGFVDDLDEEDRAYEDALLLKEIEEQESRPSAPRPQGPWDAADAPTDDDIARIDLGGLLVPVPEQTEVRVDVTQEGEVFAATLVQGDSSMQVNAFAAPRTEGIWAEVLEEIATSLTGTGSAVERLDGVHGPELRAAVPTQVPGRDGIVLAPTRFVGVDGPRWFLRAVFAGPAAGDPTAAAPLEAALRDVVVVRGSDPMAVRDALPLRLPADAQQAPDAGDEAADDTDGDDPLQLAERGPEITETR